jgi:CheY-like chemotaxis protein
MEKRLLIIEDDPDVSLLLRSKASRFHYNCEIDKTGAEWMEKIQKNQPDCIVLDMDLPKMSGFSILRQLKAHPKYQSIPVFIWSGTSDPDVMEEARALGAQAYLSKSDGLESLFEQLSRLSRSGTC